MTQTACVGGKLCGDRGHRLSCRAVCAPATKWLLVRDAEYGCWFLLPPDGAGFKPLRFNTYSEAVSWRPGVESGVDASETVGQARTLLALMGQVNGVLQTTRDAIALRQAQQGQGVIEQ